MTNREEVLKVWKEHSELLNHEGNVSELELPNCRAYVHEKLNVIEITDMEVT